MLPSGNSRWISMALLLSVVCISSQENVTVASTWSSKQGSTVSIGYGKKFTINVPWGTKDASPYFGEAITAVKKGGKIEIGPGTFLLSTNWRIRVNKTKIRGAGMGKTVLKLKNFAPVFKNGGLIYSIGTNGVTMTDLTIDGNKANQLQGKNETYGRYCIFIVTYQNWKFQRVECRNWQHYGFDPHGAKDKIITANGAKHYDRESDMNVWSRNLTIVDCVSHDNGWDGYAIDMTVGALLRNNTAYNNGRHGFNIVTESRQVVVENNHAYNNGFAPPNGFACGLLADTNRPGFVTHDVTFRYNRVDRQKGTGGVCVKGASDITFYKNTISNSVTCVTFIAIKPGVEFRSNKCVSNKKDVWYKKAGLEAVVEDNHFPADATTDATADGR